MRGFEAIVGKIVAAVDAIAAIFLIVITALTFTAVVMRYVLSIPFPGSFDVSRLLLGVAIFWGIAVAAYRRQHIQVDLFWQVLPPRLQRIIDVLSDIVFAVFMGGFAWMLLQGVQRTMQSRQTTFELAIPIWPFHAVAWLGIALCVVVILARIARALFLGGGSDPSPSSYDTRG